MPASSTIRKVGIGAALAASATAIVLAGTAFASADTSSGSSTSSSTSGAAGYGQAGGEGGRGGPGGSSDTAVTGSELSKVTAAMKAKDSAFTVTQVRKDADGSYDVLGTKAGSPVMYDVSADLATFTLHTGGPGGKDGRGGAGGSSDTAVTGSELSKVTAAMKAKDSAVTVTQVRKDADGSYDVLGTKAGSPVMYDVSADLATFTLHTGGPGGDGGPGGGHGGPDSGASAGGAAATPSAA